MVIIMMMMMNVAEESSDESSKSAKPGGSEGGLFGRDDDYDDPDAPVPYKLPPTQKWTSGFSWDLPSGGKNGAVSEQEKKADEAIAKEKERFSKAMQEWKRAEASARTVLDFHTQRTR